MNARDFVKELGMHPHPEGGYYLENYRSDLAIQVDGFNGQRSTCTSIYFLLEKNQFSALHRIKSDEIWHFYEGDPLEIIEITPEGKHSTTTLGRNILAGEKLSYVVKAGNWFASRPFAISEFSLVGCTVSPGFDFQDFEMPDRQWFHEKFPQHSILIDGLTHS